MTREGWRRQAVLVVALTVPSLGACGAEPGEPAGAEETEAAVETAAAAQIRIPPSMQREHEEIHEALVSATETPGAVGEAARELARVLRPHFEREEEIALPPLGLLEPLARGEFEPWMRDILPMTDSLAAELPQMLEEHEAIAAAAVRLEDVASEHGAEEVERLARALQLHARSEEEVLYPAAILVGEVVRARDR